MDLPTLFALIAAIVVLIVILAIGFVAWLVLVVLIGFRYEDEFKSRVPWDQWLTLREASKYARRSRPVCICVLSCIEKDIENEPLPGITNEQLEDIRKHGLAPWNVHLQRFRLIKNGRIRKRKRAVREKARLLWRPAYT